MVKMGEGMGKASDDPLPLTMRAGKGDSYPGVPVSIQPSTDERRSR